MTLTFPHMADGQFYVELFSEIDPEQCTVVEGTKKIEVKLKKKVDNVQWASL